MMNWKKLRIYTTAAFLLFHLMVLLSGFTWWVLLVIRWARTNEGLAPVAGVLLWMSLHSALVQLLTQRSTSSFDEGPEPSREGVDEPVRPLLRVVGKE